MNHTAKNILIGTAGAAGLFLASAANANADTTHTVAKNDTVWDLSQKYGVSIKSIETLNNINQNTHLIVTGQKLQIPSKAASTSATTTTTTANVNTVTVASGDSLWSIAQDYGTTVAKIRSLNNMSANASLITVGQTLKVDGTKKTTTTAVANTTATSQGSTASSTAATQTQASANTNTNTASQSSSNTTQAQASSTSQSQTTAKTASVQVTVSANHTTHTVVSGESLWTIAQDYGVTVSSLRQANNLGATLQVGEKLTINDPTKTPSAAATTTSQTSANTTTSSNNQSISANTSSNTNTTSTASTSTRSTTTQTQAATTNRQFATTTSSSVSGSAIVSYAAQFLGTPYLWGGTSPSTGFDCSGFTQYVYSHFGKSIGRVTTQQEYAGTQISVSQAQPGDLLFWGSHGSTYHVAIYVGNGSYIAAPEPGYSVSYGSIQYYMPSFAVHVN